MTNNKPYRPYTGIGSRETPFEILALMKRCGIYLARNGFTLRSGGADGADSAFAVGAREVNGNTEIYLPWPKFNGLSSPMPLPNADSDDIASRFHPRWSMLSQGAKKLHSRNVYQVLGGTLSSPSSFVICYTTNGSGAGGTGQALRVAKAYNIPIFDFGVSPSTGEKDIQEFLHSLKGRK